MMHKEQALDLAVRNAESAQHQLNQGFREWGLARMQMAQVWLQIAAQLSSEAQMMQPTVGGEKE